MYKSLRALIESALHRRSLRRWQQLADGAVSLSGEALRLNRQRGRQLRRHIDRLTHLAELHLALPMIGYNDVVPASVHLLLA